MIYSGDGGSVRNDRVEAVKNEETKSSGAASGLAETICKNTLSALRDSGMDKKTLLELIEEVYGND